MVAALKGQKTLSKLKLCTVYTYGEKPATFKIDRRQILAADLDDDDSLSQSIKKCLATTLLITSTLLINRFKGRIFEVATKSSERKKNRAKN